MTDRTLSNRDPEFSNGPLETFERAALTAAQHHRSRHQRVAQHRASADVTEGGCPADVGTCLRIHAECPRRAVGGHFAASDTSPAQDEWRSTDLFEAGTAEHAHGVSAFELVEEAVARFVMRFDVLDRSQSQ